MPEFATNPLLDSSIILDTSPSAFISIGLPKAIYDCVLAGIVFAIEELSGSFERGVSGTIITTVVLSGVVSQYLLGNYAYFGSSGASLDLVKGVVPFLVVTLVCGFLGGFFSRSLYILSGLTNKFFKNYPYRVALFSGLLVAIIGISNSRDLFKLNFSKPISFCSL